MPIRDFEADDLTAWTMRENSRLRQENESLRKDCRQLAATRNRPNSEMVKALLAEAERNVETGSKMVERQRFIIKELERDGLDTSPARSVLHELLNTQSLHLLTNDLLFASLVPHRQYLFRAARSLGRTFKKRHSSTVLSRTGTRQPLPKV
jgi:hypothetical protein